MSGVIGSYDLWRAVLSLRHVRSTQKAVLNVLALHMRANPGKDGDLVGTARPSVSTIAKLASLDRRTVQRALRALYEAEWILRWEQRFMHGTEYDVSEAYELDGTPIVHDVRDERMFQIPNLYTLNVKRIFTAPTHARPRVSRVWREKYATHPDLPGVPMAEKGSGAGSPGGRPSAIGPGVTLSGKGGASAAQTDHVDCPSEIQREDTSHFRESDISLASEEEGKQHRRKPRYRVDDIGSSTRGGQ